MKEKQNAPARPRAHLKKVYVSLEIQDGKTREKIRACISEKKAERLRRILGF